MGTHPQLVHFCLGAQLLVVSDEDEVLCLWGKRCQHVGLKNLSCLLHNHNLHAAHFEFQIPNPNLKFAFWI